MYKKKKIHQENVLVWLHSLTEAVYLVNIVLKDDNKSINKHNVH